MTKANSSTKKPRVKDTKTFIEAARIVHGETYDYKMVVYKTRRDRVKIYCKKHGVFEQPAGSHLAGRACRQCGLERRTKNDPTRKKAKKDFVKKAIRTHGKLYEYSAVEYKNNKTKVVIKCRQHGYFEQTPDSHLRGSTCPNCAAKKIQKSNRLRSKKAAEGFKKKAQEAHGEKYKYGSVIYVNKDTKVKIICPLHGGFDQTPHNHINGHGCPKCGSLNVGEKQRSTLEDFINRANARHEGKYTYEKTEYKFSNKKVVITCKVHGDFRQEANSHLQGKGCPDCAQESTSGWTRSDYVKYCKAKSKGRALLYLIKCRNDRETFYKIGITARSVESRFSRPSSMPYEYEVIREIEGDAGDIYDMETQFHRMNREKHYTPQKPFGGSVLECFSEITDDARFLLDVI